MVDLPRDYTGTVYVYCFDENEPTGGIKKLYRQVDLLNKNGISAKILHQRAGFRCSWFENTTPVTSWTEAHFTTADTLLVPEVLGPATVRVVPGVPKVVFNQNGFYTFHQHAPALSNDRETHYLKPDVIAALTVSEASMQYLGYAFPDLPIFRIYNSIDPHIFNRDFPYYDTKKLQICYMPRKNKDDAEQVFNILKYRGLLDRVKVVTIENKSEAEVAEIMKNSLVFLSFGYPEGFGLPPAEAMACGCVTIGYHGVGGLEFFKPAYGYPIEYGDIVGFAKTVEQVFDDWENNRPSLIKLVETASDFILNTYSDRHEEETTLDAWANILRLRLGQFTADERQTFTGNGFAENAPSDDDLTVYPSFIDRPLLIQTLIMAPTGCAPIRVLKPDEFSNKLEGVRALSSERNVVLNAAQPDEEKVFVWQRAIFTREKSIAQQKNLLKRGYLTVAEIDEDPRLWSDLTATQGFTYRACHCVQTASEPLAEYLRQYNPHVHVFPNHLSDRPRPRNAAEYEQAIIFFGAINREKDWQPLMETINRVVEETGNFARFEVIHDRDFFDALQTRKKNFTPFTAYEVYLSIIKRSTIAILPLLDTPRNRMKSDLKFIETGGNGLAVLASETVYGDTILENQTGLIYRSLEDFATKLRSLIVDTELRLTLAKQSTKWVAEHRLLEHHAADRARWYYAMRDRLPELNADLKARVPELFD